VSSRLATRLTAAFVVALAGMHCDSFTADPALGDDAGSVDSGQDASPTADSGAGVDAGGECTDTVVVGSNALGNGSDMNLDKAADAYGYRVSVDSVVRCAHVYLDVSADAGTTDMLIGVYEDRVKERTPEALLREARITRVANGWNVARLDRELPLAKDTLVWLAIMPLGRTVESRVVKGSKCDAFEGIQHTTFESNPRLPDPWGNSSDNPMQCNAALFLSP
jgi:hypothetical protein